MKFEILIQLPTKIVHLPLQSQRRPQQLPVVLLKEEKQRQAKIREGKTKEIRKVPVHPHNSLILVNHTGCSELSVTAAPT